MKWIAVSALCLAAALAAEPGIPAGAKVYISTGYDLVDSHFDVQRQAGVDRWPNSFFAELANSIRKQQIPVLLVADRTKADYILTPTITARDYGTTLSADTWTSTSRSLGTASSHTTISENRTVDKNVAAQLVDTKSSAIVWTCQFAKRNPKQRELVDLISKKLKDFAIKGKSD